MNETPDVLMMIIVLTILGAIAIVTNILWYFLKKRAKGKWKVRVEKMEEFEKRVERSSLKCESYIAIIILIIIVVVAIGYFLITWDI